MADYSRKVIYLSCMELGNRIRSAGFVKIERNGETLTLDMHISGMEKLSEKGKLPEKERPPENGYDICVIYASGREGVLGKIFLHGGNGNWKKSYEPGGADRDGLEDEEIERFIIRITDAETIEGKNNTIRTQAGKSNQAYQPAGERRGREPKKPELLAGERRGRAPEQPASEWRAAEPELPAGEWRGREPELSAGEWRGVETKQPAEERSAAELELSAGEWRDREPERKAEQGIRLEEVILNDKWRQLCRIYPVIHPYEDDREYISIEPKDFVIMTGDYQHMANNSFLLHGFYNYRHIILGKEKGTGESFYLGVPGVYYEREKMVALMFGFEAFECSGGVAEAGKFGYYLRKVGI